MRARWVWNNTAQESFTAWTVVARWFPKTYYLVSTLEVPTATSDDPMSVLLRKMNPDVRDTWVTQIFRCSRDGFKHPEEPLYRREYFDEQAAKQGHAELVDALEQGKHMGALLGYTPEEAMRLSWLRAVEWLGWPTFISQPILPILYLFWPYYYVLASVALATLIWRLVRYRYVSYTLSTVGCLFVRLKWPVMLVVGVYFFLHRAYFLGVLTLITPLVAMVLAPLSHGMIGVMQKRFIDELLFHSDLEALAAKETEAGAVAG